MGAFLRGHMAVLWVGVICLALLLGWCGVFGSITGRDKPSGSSETSSAGPLIPPVVPTIAPTRSPDSTVGTRVPTLTSTPRSIPTPTPWPTVSIPTATPIPVPTSTPTPIPTVTPTPRYRPVEMQETLGHSSFQFSEGPVLVGSNTIKFSAVISYSLLEPTQIQVWQSLDSVDYAGDCSTEKPIAFVGKSGGGGTTKYNWSYCNYLGATPIPCGNYSVGCKGPDAYVPWVKPKAWSYVERPGARWNSPPTKIYDYKVEINLDDERVWDLSYSSPEAYVIVVFSSDTLLARSWVHLP